MCVCVSVNIHHWFNITNISPHSPDDGSLEPKLCQLCFSINLSYFDYLVINFSLYIVRLNFHIYIYIYIYIYEFLVNVYWKMPVDMSSTKYSEGWFGNILIIGTKTVMPLRKTWIYFSFHSSLLPDILTEHSYHLYAMMVEGRESEWMNEYLDEPLSHNHLTCQGSSSKKLLPLLSTFTGVNKMIKRFFLVI